MNYNNFHFQGFWGFGECSGDDVERALQNPQVQVAPDVEPRRALGLPVPQLREALRTCWFEPFLNPRLNFRTIIGR